MSTCHTRVDRMTTDPWPRTPPPAAWPVRLPGGRTRPETRSGCWTASANVAQLQQPCIPVRYLRWCRWLSVRKSPRSEPLSIPRTPTALSPLSCRHKHNSAGVIRKFYWPLKWPSRAIGLMCVSVQKNNFRKKWYLRRIFGRVVHVNPN